MEKKKKFLVETTLVLTQEVWAENQWMARARARSASIAELAASDARLSCKAIKLHSDAKEV